MDFSKTFEVTSKLQSDIRYTFRRLTVQQAAAWRLEVVTAAQPHEKTLQALIAQKASEDQILNFSAVATTATTIPITIKHVLKHVMIGDQKVKADEWVENPDTSEDLAVEAYLFAVKGARMTAEQLGEWLSPGTSSPVVQANATSSDATTA